MDETTFILLHTSLVHPHVEFASFGVVPILNRVILQRQKI